MLKKVYTYVKSSVYFIAGILVLCFVERLTANECRSVPFLVATVMFVYGIETIIVMSVRKEIAKEPIKFINQIIILLLAIVVYVFVYRHREELVVICIIWAVWSLMREGEEIAEKVVKNHRNFIVAILYGAESLAVIIFSLLMIINPGEHHVRSHVILLGIELIMEAVCPFLIMLANKERRKSLKQNVAESVKKDE